MVLRDAEAIPPPAYPHLFSLTEGLRYYVVRPDNTMVPLVPADQLPFQLQGVPRQLNHQQLSKGKWVWVADTEETATQLSVQAPAQCLPLHPNPPSSRFLPPDHKVRAGPTEATPIQRVDEVPTISRPSLPVQEPSFASHRRNVSELVERPRSLTESIAIAYPKDAQRLGYSRSFPTPSGVEPDPTKKEFCTHWIRTGECDYTLQGCRYKHEMPTLDKLREIGFTSVPKWWKEKTALRGPTWMQRRMQEGKREESEQSTAAPNNSAVRELFKRVDRESGRGIFKDGSEHPRGILGEEDRCRSVPAPDQETGNRIPDLIDLKTPCPPSSPRASISSSTTSSDSGSDSASDTSSSPSSPRGKPAIPIQVQLPRPASTGASKAPPSTPSVDQDNPRLLRRYSELSQSSDEEADEMRRQLSTSKRTQKAPKPTPPPKPPKKSGLAKSKHAVKPNEDSKDAAKPAVAKEVHAVPGLQKQITKLTRDQHRREKKGPKPQDDRKAVRTATLV